MGEISRDSKKIHDGVLQVPFFFLSLPLGISQMKQGSEAYVLSACVRFVVFRFVNDGGGNFVAVGWKLRVREDTFRLVVCVLLRYLSTPSDRHGRR